MFVALPVLGLLETTPLQRQAWYWAHLTNVLYARQGSDPYTPHFWSLAIEEQFYLAWPIFVCLLSRRRLLGCCSACVVAGVALRALLLNRGWSHNAVYIFTLTHLDSLAIGSMVAIAVREVGLAPIQRLMRWVGPGAAVAMMALSLWRHDFGRSDSISEIAGFPLIGLAMGGFVLAAYGHALHDSSTARALKTRFLRWCGRRSYALYLVHLPILIVLRENGLALPRLTGSLGTVVGAHLALIAVNVAVTFALASASWRFYERPFMALKERFSYGRAADRVVQLGSCEITGQR
jgi:peptidoglycan/LPS O-acetylase OafA/YrhL